MKSETIAIQQVFQDRRQYRVPFYQRAYVWNRDEQWEPLWSDISEKADARAAGESPSPHFLGAIVLEPQPRTGLRGVETFHIIDGQQRLTTLQYFLAAIGIAARELGHSELLPLIEGCIWNSNPETMENSDTERFKVWPTFRDRFAFKEAMAASTRFELMRSFPTSFTQNDTLRRIGFDHPLALEAIWYFRERIDGWISESEDRRSNPKPALETIAEAALRDLRLVSISLDENDDAQVIFETLNGRGAELHATDLIRNFIFMRADREHADSEVLYDTLWSPFESPFWSEEQRRGRLRKPRLDWFIQSALQAEQADTIDLGKLYVEYRKFGLGKNTPVRAQAQLEMLTRYADVYKQLTIGTGDTAIAIFGKKMAYWDIATTHSLALRIASSPLSQYEQAQIFQSLLSYLVRRSVCGLTTKGYNNVFLQLLKRFTGKDATVAAFRSSLSALEGNASRWPRNEEFRYAWLNEPAHEHLGDVGRIRYVLTELENAMRAPRAEEPFYPSANLDIDHILPEKWYAHWPLSGKVISSEEAAKAFLSTLSAEASDEAKSIVRREQLKATFGNLTLVHYGINRSLQHHGFDEKRDALFRESNLHLNRELMIAPEWDEVMIEQRGRVLADLACEIWPSP